MTKGLKLLIAYAECEELMWNTTTYGPDKLASKLKRYGYSKSKFRTIGDFMDDLRKRALMEAKKP